MSRFIYNDFSEAEESIKKNAPPHVFKYRTWTDKFHKRFLIHQEAYFAHPFTLNDPDDVRRPVKLDFSRFSIPTARDKLREIIKYERPEINNNDLERKVIALLSQMLSNPYEYFKRNIYLLHNDWDVYDKVGVFSVSINGLSTYLWDSEYADSFKGYALGFTTVELARSLQCYIKKVTYTDEESTIDVMEGFTDDYKEDDIMTKYKKWELEEEFRFLDYRHPGENRIKLFSKEAVSEVLIGYKADEKVKEEIYSISKEIYGNFIPVYIVSTCNSGITKNKI